MLMLDLMGVSASSQVTTHGRRTSSNNSSTAALLAGWLADGMAWVGPNPNRPESTLIPNGKRRGKPIQAWALPRYERKAWAIGPSGVGLRTQNPLLIAC